MNVLRVIKKNKKKDIHVSRLCVQFVTWHIWIKITLKENIDSVLCV